MLEIDTISYTMQIVRIQTHIDISHDGEWIKSAIIANHINISVHPLYWMFWNKF